MQYFVKHNIYNKNLSTALPNPTDTNTYSDHFVQTMYLLALSRYQERDTRHFGFNVTWRHISYWRMQVCMWGQILLQRRLIGEREYKADKAFRFGDPQRFAAMQKATALTSKEIVCTR